MKYSFRIYGCGTTCTTCIFIFTISHEQIQSNGVRYFLSFLLCYAFPRGSLFHIILCSQQLSLKLNVCITKTRLFKYIEHFTAKNWKFSDKKIWYFHISAQIHRLWVLVRTASMSGSNKYPQSMFWAEIRKIMYTPVNPVLIYKSGV